MALIEINGSA